MSSKDFSQKDSAGNRKSLFGEFPVLSYDKWREEVERLLKGAPFDKKMLTETHEGITLKPIYTSKDVEGLPHLDSLPGSAPFVRGNKAIKEEGND